jgi:hypothetical protein
MAWIRPTDETARRAYRQGLNKVLTRCFETLCTLIDSPSTALTWYHEVGKVVRALRERAPDGKGDYAALSKAIGPSPAVLVKVARFAELYPEQADIQPLLSKGVVWTQLYLSFPVEDRDKRHAILSAATEGRWSIARLRKELNLKYPSGREGAGGWERRSENLGTKENLRQLRRLTKDWVHFYKAVWKRTHDQSLRKVAERLKGQESKPFQAVVDLLADLIRSAEAAVEQIKRCTN